MKIRIGRIKTVIFVVCPNHHKIHKDVYVRYLIMVDVHGYSMFIDDPNREVCEAVVKESHMAENRTQNAIYSECPFCQAETLRLNS